MFSIVWLFGVIFLLFAKFAHLLNVYIIGDKCESTHIHNDASQTENLDKNIKADVRFSSEKYRLWFSLGFNAFNCGLMLGTIIYHLIPQVK